MSGLIWSVHSKSTISSWVSTEYADIPPLHMSVTSNSASMRIESVRHLFAIASFTAKSSVHLGSGVYSVIAHTLLCYRLRGSSDTSFVYVYGFPMWMSGRGGRGTKKINE